MLGTTKFPPSEACGQQCVDLLQMAACIGESCVEMIRACVRLPLRAWEPADEPGARIACQSNEADESRGVVGWVRRHSASHASNRSLKASLMHPTLH